MKPSAPFDDSMCLNESTSYCVVGSDNYLGGMLAGRYLLERDRRKFLFVGDTSFREIRQRRAGLQKVVEEIGNNVSFYDVVLSSFSFESAFDAATNFLAATREPPDAVFAFSDTAAMAFIHAFRAAGLDIPREVSIVGYNDIPSAAYFSPPVTTIRQDIYQAGQLLVSNLIQMLDGMPARSSTIKTELIVRET